MQLDAQSNDTFVEYLDDPAQDVEISVTESVSRGTGLSNYAAYILKVTHPIKVVVERRYRQFDALRQALLIRWPGVFIPCLPPKHGAGNSNIKVVNERIKYFSYFLNCIAKVSFLFLSEEFQLFLNSNSSDLKRLYEKLQRPSVVSIVERYDKTFFEIKPNVLQRKDLMNRVNDQLMPFARSLKETQMILINIKKDLYKLATAREEYLKAIGDLYSDALPQFQKYISATFEQSSLVLLSDQTKSEKIGQAKVCKAQGYWIIYEAIRLQIGQTRAAMEAIHRRQDVQKEEIRIQKKIEQNLVEISNIKNKRTSLKQIFNTNIDQLTRQLEQQTQFLRKEDTAMQFLIQYMNELLLKHMLDFKQKRYKVWTKCFSHLITEEKHINSIFREFYKMIKVT